VKGTRQELDSSQSVQPNPAFLSQKPK